MNKDGTLPDEFFHKDRPTPIECCAVCLGGHHKDLVCSWVTVEIKLAIYTIYIYSEITSLFVDTTKDNLIMWY